MSGAGGTVDLLVVVPATPAPPSGDPVTATPGVPQTDPGGRLAFTGLDALALLMLAILLLAVGTALVRRSRRHAPIPNGGMIP